MLGGDYYTYEKKAAQSGGSPLCRDCRTSETEDILHMVSKCIAYSETRNRIKLQYAKICLESKTQIQFEDIEQNESIFCQFVLDPSSMNLQNRISMNDPSLDRFFQVSRDFCYAIHVTRMKMSENQNLIQHKPV